MLRLENIDYKFSLNRYVNKADSVFLKDLYNPTERAELKRHTILNVDQIFRILQPKFYLPIFGPFEYPVKVSNTVLNLTIASMLTINRNSNFKNRQNTYHAVTFSPYHTIKDIENDIVQLIKLLSISDANPFKVSESTPLVKLHIFGTKHKSDGIRYTSLDFTESTSKVKWSNHLTLPIEMLEKGYHLPITPCLYTCPFKEQCNVQP